jgi:hypothetical protein
MVPNPMLSKIGRTAKGTFSEHSLEATARRIYLVIECDFSVFEKPPTQARIGSELRRFVLSLPIPRTRRRIVWQYPQIDQC